MRHATITLTMDTYGHLFPGQEADAVDRLRHMLVDDRSAPQSLRATETTDRPEFAQRQAQRAERETLRSAATPCHQPTSPAAQENSPKPLRVADLDDAVRVPATARESSGGGIRTPDTRIMIPLTTRKTPGKTAYPDNCAAPDAAHETAAAALDVDLQSVIEHWPNLPPAVKAGIVAMVRASGTISNNGTETGSRAWTPR